MVKKEEDRPVKLLISNVVEPNRIEEYLAWSTRITKVLRGQRGFIDSDNIAPSLPNSTEYLIIIRFQSEETLNEWLRSEVRETLLREASPFLKIKEIQRAKAGDIWFFPVTDQGFVKSPHFLKRVTLSFCIVLPLIWAVPTSVSFIQLGNLIPDPFSFLFSVFIISYLMTYLIPRATKLLGFWLYPKNNQK